MSNYKNIKWKYLLSLLFIFTLIISIRIYTDNKHYDNLLKQRIDFLAKDIEEIFNLAKDNVQNRYKMLAIGYIKSPYISEMMEVKDKDKLYDFLIDNYTEYKQIDPNLYVMHFMDTKNITILRMHKPQSFNDDLTTKRPMLNYVNKSLVAQHAFEVGKNGIVYRITTPYLYENKHLGVLEFGIKLKAFVDILNTHFQIKSTTLVKTNLLKNLTAQKRYKSLGDYSIVSSDNFFTEISAMIDLSKKQQIITKDDKTYIIFTNLNLQNYQNEIVAKIIIAKDITPFIIKNESALMFANSLTFVVFLFILIILYLMFTRYSQELEETLKTINQLHEKSIHFENKSNSDDLTKIYNKSYFDSYIDKFLKLDKDGVLIFFDIDHFKKINDTYGHIAGDKILILLTKTIKKFLRTDDLFIRWGGEEFIVVLHDISFELAVKKANSLRLLVENTTFIDEIPVKISLGVTKVQRDDSKEIMLKRADKLLYEAKNSGRNCVKTDLT